MSEIPQDIMINASRASSILHEQGSIPHLAMLEIVANALLAERNATARRVEAEALERARQFCAGCTGQDARQSLVGTDPTDLAESLEYLISNLPRLYKGEGS